MIETVAAVNLMVEEVLKIKKNRLTPDVLTGKEKRICIVSGIYGDELQGQYVCYELIRRISACFAEALGARPEEIGPDADFFLELGGTSLDYFALREELKAELGSSFPLESAALHTVRQFADYLRSHREIG